MAVLPLPHGSHEMLARGENSFVALLVVNAESPTRGAVIKIPFVSGIQLPARPATSFQPVVNSWRRPNCTVRLWRTRIVSSMNHAPNQLRKPIPEGAGITWKLLDVPCRNVVRLANVAWPK